MITLQNYRIDKQNRDLYYITIPFDKDFPLLKVNFDIDNADVEADGKAYTVVDCLVSDNGEWINLVCNRIFTSKEETRLRIGQRIAQLRKMAGMSQEQLALAAGLQRTHVSRIEAGKYAVKLETIQSIAEALGMTVDIIDTGLEGLAPLKRLSNTEK